MKPPATVDQIHIVYPHPSQHIYEDSTFLMGNVTRSRPEMRLWVNGQEVPLSPHGYFSFPVPVHAGMNAMKLSLRLSESTPPVSESLFALYGVPPVTVLPALPLAVHAQTLQPDMDVWLSPSDSLTVSCSASINAAVSFSLPGWMDQPLPLSPVQSTVPFLENREMIFAQLHWTQARVPVQGAYRTIVSVKTLLENANEPGASALPGRDFPILLHLRHGEHYMTHSCPGKVRFLAAPRRAVVSSALAVSRTAPVNGARLTPQLAGTAVWVDGLQAGWARVRFSETEAFYLPVESLQFSDKIPMTSEVGDLALCQATVLPAHANEAQVDLLFATENARPCPLFIDVLPVESGARLQIRLSGVVSRCDFIYYPPESDVVRQIHWRQVAEHVLEVWIELLHPLSGYDYAWHDGVLRISVKHLPALPTQTRILIDPGHGGVESGSTGLNGLLEKALNLTVSRLLETELKKQGFEVEMTRSTDQTVSLEERGRAVQHFQADMVLSIHHNALPDGRNPLLYQGAGCFYYQSFSKPLAEALLKGLTQPEVSGKYTIPNNGLFYDSLYMTRIHQALAVLVEIGFFTHPMEFERLLEPAFQQEVAERLAQAVAQYCRSSENRRLS